MRFVCPRCKGELKSDEAVHHCAKCELKYPVICGIPDFRLFADPYIDMEADRAKGLALASAIAGMTFSEAVNYYYSITPDDPVDLAATWTARALAETEIARQMLPLAPRGGGVLLDIGCSTGAALIAAGGGIGVDVAFRWLVIGQLRMRETGTPGELICANGEHLPFPDDLGASIVCFDTLEHLRDPVMALREMRRVGTGLLLTSNNRWSPLPEPHVHLLGVGWLPRKWQRKYVRWRRGDLHPYRIQLWSAAEGLEMARSAGWNQATAEAAPVYAPHLGATANLALRMYRGIRRWPGMQWVGPRWMLRC